MNSIIRTGPKRLSRLIFWEVTRHSTGVSRMEGYRTLNLHASYVHLYFPQASSLISEIFNLSPEKIKVDN
jgi:hypothetical protein